MVKSSRGTPETLAIVPSTIQEIEAEIQSHVESLSYPMDSWLEDSLLGSVVYKLICETTCIGYAAQLKQVLQFLYVRKGHFRYAPLLLERFIAERAIKRVFIMSQDALLSALMAEWDHDKEKQGCFFTDSGRGGETGPVVSHAMFRTATSSDLRRIQRVDGGFFDEASGGFSSLAERIEAKTIFILEDESNLLGCGIVEKGRICLDCVSIGMFVNRDFRGKGCARTILLHLKEWAYNNGLRPVAGCWYYNTLSRKSLESAGMTATSIGFEAILKGKERLPLRTGNPPGELVEEKSK
jgi:GNAT superfamily N-acetyltransferase